jgi:WD40 repeat protein
VKPHDESGAREAPAQEKPSQAYDLFIAYSWVADRALVSRLQTALERFGRPWFRPRTIRVFRDDSSLPMTSDLWVSICSGIERSRFFLLIASPESAALKADGARSWATREAEHFLGLGKGDLNLAQRFGIAVTAGQTPWTDQVHNDSTCAVAPTVIEALHEQSRQPLVIDLRARHNESRFENRSRFDSAVATIAAGVMGRDKDELFGAHLRRQRIALLTTVAVAAVLSGLALAAIQFSRVANERAKQVDQQRTLAEERAREATRQRLIAEERALEVSRQQTHADQQRALAEQKTLEATEQRHRAEERTRDAENQRAAARQQLIRTHVALAQTLLVSNNEPRATAYLVAARQSGLDNVAIRTMFQWATQTCPDVILPRRESGISEKTAITWTHDERHIRTAGDDGIGRAWELSTSKSTLPSSAYAPRDLLAVAWSPDSTLVATISGRDLEIWDARKSQVLFRRENDRRGPPHLLLWSPDGKRILSAGDGAKTWGILQGMEPHLALTNAPVSAAAWSPDSAKIAIAHNQGLEIFGIDTRSTRSALIRHPDAVKSVTWSPNGTRLAIASSGIARVLDVSSGREVTQWRVEGSDSISLSWNPSGVSILSISGNYAQQMDPESGRAMAAPLAYDSKVRAVSWSPDGTKIAIASWDVLRVWDVATGQPLSLPLPLRDGVKSITWSPSGVHVAVESSRAIAIWRTTRSHARLLPLVHDSSVLAMAWTPNGARLSTTTQGRIRWTWEGRTGQLVSSATRDSVPTSSLRHPIAWNHDATMVAVASEGNSVQVIDGLTGKPVSRHMHKDQVTALSWSPDGRRVASASARLELHVWDAVTGLLSLPSIRTGDLTFSLRWSPDGSSVAAAVLDGGVRMWDATTGRLRVPPLVHGDGVRVIEWSHDGALLASAGYDNTAQIWDSNTGRARSPRLQHSDNVSALSWSANGHYIATSSRNLVQIWDARSGRLLSTPISHSDDVIAISWAPDGSRLATASRRYAQVWDPHSGQAVLPSFEHADLIAIAWNPLNDSLATTSLGGTARIWDTSPDWHSLADWHRVLPRCGFSLSKDGVLVPTFRQERAEKPVLRHRIP